MSAWTSSALRAVVRAMPVLLAPGIAQAQDIEPRAYLNAPVGLNFFVAAAGDSQGGLAVDPALPLQGAQLHVRSAVLAYVRVLDLWGRSAKLDVVLPYASLSGTATVAGEPAQRHVSGFGDPKLRLSVNLLGAPALSPKDFAGYRRDLVVGASIQVTPPTGQYDKQRLVNLGSHRWSVKPDVGFSKTFGAITLDVTASATFFSANHDYVGKTLEQRPIVALQTNLSVDFSPSVWGAVGATYYRGGRTVTDGVDSQAALANSRAALVLAVALDRRHSLKFSLSDGLSIRTGTDFRSAGIAWQTRWGGGI